MKIMLIVKANEDSESGRMPTTEELAEMGAYNEELANAGVLLAGEGLLPSSTGARVSFTGQGASTVTEGPFAGVGELVAGYWIIDVASKEDAVAWARRIPFGEGGEVEVRKVAEAEDFGEAFTPELREAEADLRARTAERLH